MGKCKHKHVRAVLGSWQCVACLAKGVRSLGPSNDDSPAVRLEMLAAIHLGGRPGHLPDAWNARNGVVEFGDSERIPETWAWDTSRLLADQFAETAALDAQADREETRAACNTAALIADFNAKGAAYSALCDAFDAEDDYDLQAGGPALTAAEVAAYLDPPLTVTIDSAVQINGLCDVPPLFTPDDAEALADDLLLGADAARQAQRDGYHGPAVVVDLVTGEESELGVEFEVEPVFCAAPHDGDCAPAAWGNRPMVCVVPLRAALDHTPDCDTMTSDVFLCNCEPEQRRYLTQINEHEPGTPYPGTVIRRSFGRDSTAPSPDDVPIRAGAPEAIGLTPRQLREQAAAAVASEDALRDPEVTARNAARLTVHPADDNCKLIGASGCRHDDMTAEETQAVFGEERGDG